MKKFIFLGFISFCFFSFQALAQGRSVNDGVYYGDEKPLIQNVASKGVEAKIVVQDTVGIRKVPTAHYAGAVVLSFFLGFGLGSFLEGDKPSLISFAVLDSVFFATAVSLTGAYYGGDKGPDSLHSGMVAMWVLYGLTRFAELVYNVAYPFLIIKTVKTADYYKSRERFVLNRMPLPFVSGKGGGLSYAYTFKD